MIDNIMTALQNLRDPLRVAHHQHFFKTGPGDYGEGDVFLGLTVPQVRRLARHFGPRCGLSEINELLYNPYHEARLLALLMMTDKFNKADAAGKTDLFQNYLRKIRFVNNWDLVDLSAPAIAGAYTFPNPEKLWELAKSGHLWSERASVVAHLYYIRRGVVDPALQTAEFFIPHRHDLIHKACGWILRETGKKVPHKLTNFLDKHAPSMPRTMLRYALEKLPEEKRKHYMAQKNLAY